MKNAVLEFWNKRNTASKIGLGFLALCIFNWTRLGLISAGILAEPRPVAALAAESSPTQPPPVVLTAAQQREIHRQQLTSQIEELKQSASTAQALVSAFEANEVRATDRFKGRQVIVTGRVQRIRLDVAGDAFVVLGDENEVRGVQCTFENKPVVADLQRGQLVTISGECAGLMLNVQLTNCTVRPGLAQLRAQLKTVSVTP